MSKDKEEKVFPKKEGNKSSNGTSDYSTRSGCEEIFSPDETKSAVNTLCICEHFCKIWQKKIKQDECTRIIRGDSITHIKRDQAIKSTGRMPWHQEPKKDVTSCDKLRRGANILGSADFRMGEPGWAIPNHRILNT